MNPIERLDIIVTFTLFILLIFFFIISLAIRYRKRRLENEELQIRFTEEKLRIQVEIQEETLKHVSRELHDNLGHIASLIKINLNTIKMGDPDLENKLENTRIVTRQLIHDLKLLSLKLSDNQVVENGLLAAITNELNRLERTGLYKGRLLAEANADAIDNIGTDRAIILYRIVQEVINNFIKHSKGTELNVTISNIEKSIILELRDNGVGFNEEHLSKEGSGLKNMRYRAELIDASLNIKSIVGSGTYVIITLPYKLNNATSKVSLS